MGKQVFIRKKEAFDIESRTLANRLEQVLHLHLPCVVYHLYEVEGLDGQALLYFQQEILGDQVTDIISNSIDATGKTTLAYTYLPGHFDQKAYYARQAGSLVIDHSDAFTVRSSTVVVFDTILDRQTVERIRSYLINPVDTRERSLDYEKPPKPVEKPMYEINGFASMETKALEDLKNALGLTMDLQTLGYIQTHYRQTQREATETELFLLDTYWSDHCRHTTFLTRLEDISISGRYAKEIEKSFSTYMEQRKELGRSGPITLMDLATHSQRYLKAKGKLGKVEHSDEINACSVHVSDNKDEYLLMFKNETHNHPTEIEPFGGAQTCLGGAIRDPLSGRSFVFQGVRISGSADPTARIEDTLANKLPQSTIARESAKGFSSYGNQIGMATTFVREIYHPSYVAKHLELGAVVGMTKRDEVVRLVPQPGDIVVLLGGRTGKDGIGGASGSSVSHTSDSLDSSYAQIQKGNPLEERKLQRLFRIPEVKRCIKRSNDFGAGGVSVAIGELASGITIDLDAVPLKTEGMNATEIAISESQERMAIVIDPMDYDTISTYAAMENVEASRVALITPDNRLVMLFQGKTVVDIDRTFLDTNGPLPSQHVHITDHSISPYDTERYRALNNFSQKALGELFDSSVGNSTLFSPYGGMHQTTPELSSVQRFCLNPDTDKASVVSYGFDPRFSEVSPYRMGMYAVLSSIAKQIATGGRLEDIHLSLQEYFPKPGTSPERWGLVLQALLGAFEVCNTLSVAAIGGKDSMSGSYEELDVIPTLVGFAFGEVPIDRLRSRAFKASGQYLYVLRQNSISGLPDLESFMKNIAMIERHGKKITAISTLDEGLSHTLEIMSWGNEIGYTCSEVDSEPNPGSFVFTTTERIAGLKPIGRTTTRFNPLYRDIHLNGLSTVYPLSGKSSTVTQPPEVLPSQKRYFHTAIETPVVLIVTFSGTNSELDMQQNFDRAGGKSRLFVVNDTSHEAFERSVEHFIEELAQSHILVFPGGFSYSDEPDGSGKFIAAFLKNAKVRIAVDRFVEQDHLVLGICNGFQGLVKSGLLPYGSIRERKEDDPTLFFNDSYRHIARLTRTRIHSLRSPWLQDLDPDLTYTLPVSHSEGKFIADRHMLDMLIRQDQVATTYVDNPNGSTLDIEGIVSPNGNILGKMAHNERIDDDLFINVEGCRRQDIFSSGIRYFQKGGNAR